MTQAWAWRVGVFLVSGLAFAQQSANPPEAELPVLRVTVNLVQVDAVVTDSAGRQVTDLTANDFEVLEDGRPQKIRAFSYVKTGDPTRPEGSQPASRVKNPIAPPMPAAPPLARQQVQRTVVLMVDDLGLSFESTYFVRRALKKFVDTQMQEGDLVAIVRTSAGMGSLQQFTADKRILYEAIDRVRFVLSRGSIGIFPALGSDPTARALAMSQPPTHGHSQPASPANGKARGKQDFQKAADAGHAASSTIGALGAVSFIVSALRDLPGRKAVILFSDGIAVSDGGPQMQRLADLANRAAVVIYTVDARGLQGLALTAADNPALTGNEVGQSLAAAAAGRREVFAGSQQGLEYLAQQTGGLFIHDDNDLADGVHRVLNDMSGYYLIGYKPDESRFAPDQGYRSFHKIQVKLKVRGLQVRSRTGYLGISDEESRPVYRSPHEQLLAQLISPFTSGDLKLRLTCLFSEVPKVGAVVRSLLYVDPRSLTYTAEAGGIQRTNFDIVVFAFDEQGAIVGSADGTVNARLNPEEYAQAMRVGILYTMDVRLAKPGGYQVRAAVRDKASEKFGSASQFVDVPDVPKRRLALSGIVLSAAGSAIGQQDKYGVASAGSPAVRMFGPGQIIHYSYAIFNPELDAKSGHAEIETQVLLYRESKSVFTGTVTPFKSSQTTDLSRLLADGALRLGADLEPGEYEFQIAVWDKLAPQSRRVATQSIDLEVR